MLGGGSDMCAFVVLDTNKFTRGGRGESVHGKRKKEKCVRRSQKRSEEQECVGRQQNELENN